MRYRIRGFGSERDRKSATGIFLDLSIESRPVTLHV